MGYTSNGGHHSNNERGYHCNFISHYRFNVGGAHVEKLLLKRGFTDKLYFYNLRFAWIFTWACFALTALSGEKWLNIADMSIVSAGLPVVWGELSIHTGFIIWKAKTENCRKHKDQSKIKELEEVEL